MVIASTTSGTEPPANLDNRRNACLVLSSADAQGFRTAADEGFRYPFGIGFLASRKVSMRRN